MSFSSTGAESYSVADKCLSLFPSVTSETYKPFLPYSLQSSRPDNLLEAVSATLQVSASKEVCFFQPGVSKPEMFPLQYLDAKMLEYNLCIMPPDGSWLLYRGENKCWQWGKKHEHAHLFDTSKKRFFIHWGSGGLPALKNIFLQVANKLETGFDTDDFCNSEAAFRASKSDSFVYIIQGAEVWVEITMRRDEGYYSWQCLTQNRALVEPWRAWFNHYR